MPILENDQLIFRFPQIEEDASLAINFQRTLRIPDSEREYPLPPGLGSFSLRHVDDYAESLPAQTVTRGGVMLPMWQSEATWIAFKNFGPYWDLPFPVAIKVAAGKINAVTGQAWRAGLHRDPQDYMVSPEQPWLDGFAVAEGVVRQFVAMPLGAGFSAEEQVTGEAEWGGLQILVVPLKAKAWKSMRSARDKQARDSQARDSQDRLYACLASPPPLFGESRAEAMGLGAGGKIKQIIYPDPFTPDDWDLEASERVFVTMINARDWFDLTGEAPREHPPTAKEYSKAGLPWFEYYGLDQSALPGSKILAGVKSVATLVQEETGDTLLDSEDVETGKPIALGAKRNRPRVVRSTF